MSWDHSLLDFHVYELLIHFELKLELDFSLKKIIVSSCLRHAEEEKKNLGYISGVCAGRRELSRLAAAWRQPHPWAPVGVREAGAPPRGIQGQQMHKWTFGQDFQSVCLMCTFSLWSWVFSFWSWWRHSVLLIKIVMSFVFAEAIVLIFLGGENPPFPAAAWETWWQHSQIPEWLIVPQPQQWDPEHLHQHLLSDFNHDLWKCHHTQWEQWLWLSRHWKPSGSRERAGYQGVNPFLFAASFPTVRLWAGLSVFSFSFKAFYFKACANTVNIEINQTPFLPLISLQASGWQAFNRGVCLECCGSPRGGLHRRALMNWPWKDAQEGASGVPQY